MMRRTGHILVIDDDSEMQVFLRRCLTSEGHRVTTCSSGSEAESLLFQSVSNENDFDLVLCDVNMPGMNGIDFVKRCKAKRPALVTVMITAFGSIESAVEAMRDGAQDYLTKPIKVEELLPRVERAIEVCQKTFQNEATRQDVNPQFTLGDMIGKSPEMKFVFDLIRKVAKVSTNVLILGESGTGKEMVARAIHDEGPRAERPFVAINCAAMPENLLESELFGHAKGSFTGAVAQKRGLIEEAEGGTLFLDEIGDMELSLQAKLLRVLQERRIRAVGQNNFKNIDVRIIAATLRDLKNQINLGKFREDLYFRLSVVPVVLPPLRERREDIPLFAEYFLKKYSRNSGLGERRFTDSALKKLVSLNWEGNVRQLENTVERAAILTDGPIIDETHIDANFSFFPLPAVAPATREASSSRDPQKILTMKEMEKHCLEQALQEAGGKKEKAAQLLGISRKTLYRKEREFGL